MRTNRILVAGWVTSAILLASAWHTTCSAGPLSLINLLTGRGADVRQHHCDTCCNVHDPDGPCITRRPVEDCVVGKKEVFDCTTRNEYMSIPVTRYRWTIKRLTKEIPCPYCKPVCKTEDCLHCFGEEQWVNEGGCGCEELHCKHIVPKFEKLPTKRCEHEMGETTITARYWSCVKEPYTIYRQVKKPVCVKMPRYEKVNVPVTRYVCDRCGGIGCGLCGK